MYSKKLLETILDWLIDGKQNTLIASGDDDKVMIALCRIPVAKNVDAVFASGIRGTTRAKASLLAFPLGNMDFFGLWDSEGTSKDFRGLYTVKRLPFADDVPESLKDYFPSLYALKAKIAKGVKAVVVKRLEAKGKEMKDGATEVSKGTASCSILIERPVIARFFGLEDPAGGRMANLQVSDEDAATYLADRDKAVKRLADEHMKANTEGYATDLLLMDNIDKAYEELVKNPPPEFSVAKKIQDAMKAAGVWDVSSVRIRIDIGKSVGWTEISCPVFILRATPRSFGEKFGFPDSRLPNSTKDFLRRFFTEAGMSYVGKIPPESIKCISYRKRVVYTAE